jgi:hypothetical protein
MTIKWSDLLLIVKSVKPRKRKLKSYQQKWLACWQYFTVFQGVRGVFYYLAIS